jgi:hypothetical protein
MKITKRQLRRIIKEEKANLISEMGPKPGQMRELHDVIDRLISTMGPDEVARELEGIAEEIRSGPALA